MTDIVSLEVLAERVVPGASLAVPTDYAGVAIAATHALIRIRVGGNLADNFSRDCSS